MEGDLSADRRCRAPWGRGGHVLRVLGLAGLLLAALGSQSGCATSLRQWWHNGAKVGPNYARPPAPVAAEWVQSEDPRVSDRPADDCCWWTAFDDPALNGLVEAAYRQNLDLRSAATRILEARAQRGIAVGNLFPQSQSATSAYAHAQISRNLNIPFPSPINIWADGLNASWELDFWGRYRRAIESSNADLQAAVEDYGDVLVMLLAEVATTYVELRTYEERLVYARANVDIQAGSLQLAEERLRDGVATDLDTSQARSNLTQTQSLIPPLEAGRRQASNRLCVLLGMPVMRLADELPATGIPHPPVDVAVGIPADLLRRRPDVRRAERQVAAQSAQIGVAAADLYPRLTLNGFVGYAANDLRKVFDSNSFLGFVIPTLQWNIVNYGRIANNIRVQDARLEERALAYQQAVLNAGREVEDALVGFLEAQRQAEYLDASVEEADRFVKLVVAQYEAGVTDFNRVFNAQSLLANQQDQLALARGTIAQQLIQVYRALGGGWEYFLRGCGMPGDQGVVRAVDPRPAPQASTATEEIPAGAPVSAEN